MAPAVQIAIIQSVAPPFAAGRTPAPEAQRAQMHQVGARVISETRLAVGRTPADPRGVYLASGDVDNLLIQGVLRLARCLRLRPRPPP